MRLVVAVIKPAQVESVRLALAAVQVTRLTVCDVHGYDLAAPDPLAQEVMIEIAVNDDFVGSACNAISAVLAAGGEAAGRLFVFPMDEAVQIYRAVRGPEAV